MSLCTLEPPISFYSKLRKYLAATLLICPSLAAGNLTTAEQNTRTPASDFNVTEVTLWTGSKSEVRKAHETDVVRLALEKSRGNYGPYHLSILSTAHSKPRTIRNLSDGNIAQVITAPAFTYWVDSPEQPLITIPIPLLQGLLGKRKVIIRRDRAADFAKVTSLQLLRQFNAGIGADWLEKDYFREAELTFTTGSDITQLLNMLVHKRFDYLPLGILEVDSALAASEHANVLSIVDSFTIHYPLPVYVQVSRSHPELAERLTLGLEQARNDGSLAALFDKHYGQLKNLDSKAVAIELPVKPRH